MRSSAARPRRPSFMLPIRAGGLPVRCRLAGGACGQRTSTGALCAVGLFLPSLKNPGLPGAKGLRAAAVFLPEESCRLATVWQAVQDLHNSFNRPVTGTRKVLSISRGIGKSRVAYPLQLMCPDLLLSDKKVVSQSQAFS